MSSEVRLFVDGCASNVMDISINVSVGSKVSTRIRDVGRCSRSGKGKRNEHFQHVDVNMKRNARRITEGINYTSSYHTS